MVDLAISSLALAIFSRTQRHLPAAREASLRHGRLLHVAQDRITQKGILESDEKGVDECLFTVVLTAWYETAMHQPANRKSEDSFGSLHSWSHHDGVIAILKAWNNNNNHNLTTHNAPSSSIIIKQARRGRVRSALLGSRPLPDWMRDGGRFGEHDLDLGFDDILFRVANLRYAFKRLEQQKEDPDPDLLGTAPDAKNLNDQARKLSRACRAWAAQIPSAWSHQPHGLVVAGPGISWPRRDFYGTPPPFKLTHNLAMPPSGSSTSPRICLSTASVWGSSN